MNFKDKIVPLTLDAYLSVCPKCEFLVFVIDNYKIFTDDNRDTSRRTKVGYFTTEYLQKNMYSKYLNTEKFSVGLQNKGSIQTLTIDIRED